MIRATVPTKLLSPIIERYLEQYDMEMWRGGREPSPLVLLAGECGINPRRLHRILSGETEEVHFDVADTLLCKMGLVMLWYTPPLSDVYWTLDLTEYEPKKKRAVLPRRPAFSCGHEQTHENMMPDPKGCGVTYFRCRVCFNARRRERRKAKAA